MSVSVGKPVSGFENPSYGVGVGDGDGEGDGEGSSVGVSVGATVAVGTGDGSSAGVLSLHDARARTVSATRISAISFFTAIPPK
jgi:hypothetical protein